MVLRPVPTPTECTTFVEPSANHLPVNINVQGEMPCRVGNGVGWLRTLQLVGGQAAAYIGSDKPAGRFYMGFYNEFDAMLTSQNKEHLGCLLELCCRVPGTLSRLKQALEAYILREGHACIQQIAQAALNDSELYIQSILGQHAIYKELVVDVLNWDYGLVGAMDKAFMRLVNDNEYCDQLLRKSVTHNEEMMDEQLEQVMTVFKYIEDKDMFEAFFHKALCKRLVTGTSASEQAERSMVAKLKQMCGFEYTNRLERLLNDVMTLSREHSDTFRKLQISAIVDFSVIVVMSNLWTLPQPIQQFELPAPLVNCCEAFRTYYNFKHPGRKLNWMLQMSRGELTSVDGTFAQKYLFTCNTQQMSVLMLYNQQRDSYSMDELSTELGMPNDQLLPVLQSLTKTNLLKDPQKGGEESGGEANDSNGGANDVYHINLEFTNRKLKVDLIRAMSTAGQQKRQLRDNNVEKEVEMQKNMDQDREIVIQVALMRIMKMRKSLKHQQLMGEVLSQLNNRFQPKVSMVKKCIDMLIEKDYLKRAVEHDTYEYLA